jgi:glycosyltransferase involved in cell wall biosynthesis
MKVVLIGSLASGILGFRRDIIIHLVNEGHEVYAFASDYDPDSRHGVELLGAVPVDYVLSRTGMNPLKDISTIISLFKSLSQIKPDVVYSFFMKPVIYGSLAAKLTGVSNICSMIEGLGYSYTPERPGQRISIKKRVARGVLNLLLNVAFKASDKVLLLNDDDRIDLQRFCGLNSIKTHVLGPIGLNLKDYPYRKFSYDGGPMRFIFVGRLLREKGIKEYLDAARYCRSKRLNAEFVVLGAVDADNPESISLEELQSYIEDRSIVYPGFVDDVNRWVSSAHVFVLPSYYREGVPRSTQEAMAIGCAVLTTNLPGCKDTLEPGGNGLYVEPWDHIDLAHKMEWCVVNIDSVERFSQRSCEIARERFDVRIVNQRLTKILLS